MYKGIVSGGKGNGSIVILFPKNLQKFIETMIDIRNSTELVPKTNQYLFAYLGMAEKYVCGEKFIKKFDEKSHANNPQLITSNNL